MQATIAGFSPVFNPADASLVPTTFGVYLDSLEAANTAVNTTGAALKDSTDLRRAEAVLLKETALRVKDHVTGNVNWQRWHQPVGRAADKVRGLALPKPKAPSETPPSPARQGAKTQQGYADLEYHFGALLAALDQVQGYSAPGGSGLELTSLALQRDGFAQKNDAVKTAEADNFEAIRARQELYDDALNGLNVKMKAIKKATRSQYGATSAEYAAVRAIRL
jgi:hypothetical protein